MRKSGSLSSWGGMRAVLLAALWMTLLLASSAAMAVAPGPESDPNDVYWDDAFALPGVDGLVNAMVRDAAGNLYIGGSFAYAGKALASNIAKWDGTTWSALGTGMDNEVRALVVDSAGNLYAGGLFANAGGAPASGVAKWNGTAWSDIGTGMTNPIYALAIDASDTLYAGGYQILYRRGPADTAWTSLGTVPGSATALAVDGSGNLYAGGDFTDVGGVTVNYVAKWDGATWCKRRSRSVPGVVAVEKCTTLV